MENQLLEKWNISLSCANEISNLIKFALEDRTKQGDVESLEKYLETYNQNVKEAIELIKKDS